MQEQTFVSKTALDDDEDDKYIPLFIIYIMYRFRFPISLYICSASCVNSPKLAVIQVEAFVFPIFTSQTVLRSPFQDALQPIFREADNNAAMYHCWWS